MKTFLLFIFGVFEDEGDIEFFCMEILGQSLSISSIKYVIENNQNVIIIFDSDVDHGILAEEIHTLSQNESIKFYFLMERQSMVSVFLPDPINDFIFKPSSSDPKMIKIEYQKHSEVKKVKLELDDLLDKIKLYGVDSLTVDEKNFLDNFEN